MPILTTKSFHDWVKETYQVSNGAIISDLEIDEEYADAEK